jgi:serine 3-dehydrogenase
MSTKTILVTGASAGFGGAIAAKFADSGWRVVACARRAERLAQLVERYGHERIHAAAFDLRDGSAMQAALEALPRAFRDIDVLVNNAGLPLGVAMAQDCDPVQWRQMIDTNVTALAMLTRSLLPQLIARHGAIINMSSISGTYPYPGGNVYGATKAFVTQFSLGLRCDLHGTGVRVTSVEPGLAETEFTLVRTGGDAAASDKLYRGAHPITADDVAETVWWIANLPAHLNVNRIEVMPVSQSPAGLQVARDP